MINAILFMPNQKKIAVSFPEPPDGNLGTVALFVALAMDEAGFPVRSVIETPDYIRLVSNEATAVLFRFRKN